MEPCAIRALVHMNISLRVKVFSPRKQHHITPHPRQLQKPIAMPTHALPKSYSQIPRFPQPSFPDRPRISVSCSWMTDGYPQENTHVGVWL